MNELVNFIVIWYFSLERKTKYIVYYVKKNWKKYKKKEKEKANSKVYMKLWLPYGLVSFYVITGAYLCIYKYNQVSLREKCLF